MQDRIRFLFDENVRSDVVEIFRERGHEVIQSRDVLAISAPDQLLALLGKFESLVIVTHDKDFRKYRQMLPDHGRSRFTAGAGRLQLEIAYELSLQRVTEEIENIEHHYRQAIRRRVPFIMSIQKANIRITTK